MKNLDSVLLIGTGLISLAFFSAFDFYKKQYVENRLSENSAYVTGNNHFSHIDKFDSDGDGEFDTYLLRTRTDIGIFNIPLNNKSYNDSLYIAGNPETASLNNIDLDKDGRLESTLTINSDAGKSNFLIEKYNNELRINPLHIIIAKGIID